MNLLNLYVVSVVVGGGGVVVVIVFAETLCCRIKENSKAWSNELSIFDVMLHFFFYCMKPHLKYKEVNEVRMEKVGKFYQPSPT